MNHVPAPAACGVLYLIATPVGNLEDISARALRLLAAVDLVLCEDTRHTGRLLHHFRISTPTLSYHEHNEERRAVEAVEMLRANRSVALVSDAGTPAINDPGFRLVRLCIEAGITVTPVPGAAAFILALIASGLPTDEFLFGGFLPARGGERRKRLDALRTLSATLIFYEAPHRILASLGDAREILGDRRACVARELTKLHEQFLRDTLTNIAERIRAENLERGEMTVVIEGKREDTQTLADEARVSIAARVRALEDAGVEPRQALKLVARELGLPRAEAYRRVVAEKNRDEG